MIELPLIFISGVLGSSHCIGMCGPFAAILGSAATGWRQNVTWQLLYSLGRIFTYATLGAMAGYGGQRLAGLKLASVNATALLALAAGMILIYEGLVSAGFWERLFPVQGTGNCATGGLLRSMLKQQSRTGVFLAGVATGFLPCGLVYAFLLIAVRAGNLFLGGLVMAIFGLGTVPLMVATGTSASLIPLRWRHRLFVLAGWSVVLMGALSLYRGWTFLTVDDPAACPFCL
jgi:sulfite exporter TauE/SafE